MITMYAGQDEIQDGWMQLESEIMTCTRCPRLVAWRQEVARVRRRAYRDETYWGKPVPGFGDWQALVLVVGLAPGAHGANRTGRLFTGDSSGDFLFAAMHRAGFASQACSTHRGDGMTLRRAFVSSVCRCVPPDNKPTPEEVTACIPYLERELYCLGQVKVIVALGRTAFDGLVRTLDAGHRLFHGASNPDPRSETGRLSFGHGAEYRLRGQRGDESGGVWLIASYHPSRQNTQTGRLTQEMFDSVWARANALL